MKAPYRLAAVFLTMWPALVSAQVRTDLGAVTLDDLMKLTITTASRNAEGVRDAAAKVEVVTAQQIVARGYRCLSDLLADIPGFKLDFAGDSDYPAEFTVQGTRGMSRIVLLLDGIRVSSPTGEPLPIVANYPVNQARQVEIVFGPSSALYGADAFSAVVNIISKDIYETKGFSFTTSAGMFGLYNQTASYGTRIGHASLIVNAQRLVDGQPDMNRYYPADFGGMQGQRSGVFNTIYGPMTLDSPVSPDYHAPIAAHAVHALLRSGGWQVSLFHNRSRLSTTPAYTPDNAVYSDGAFNDNRLLVGAASYAGHIGDVMTTTTMTASRHELSPQSGYRNVYSNMQRSYKYAYGSMLKIEEQLSWKPTRRATITAGATFERFHAIPQGADLNEPIRSQSSPGTILGTTIVDNFYEQRYSNSGGFAQLQVDAMPGVTLTLGGRADHNTQYGRTFNPRVGLVMRPAAGTTFKLLYGSAYLAPSPYQSYGHYGSFFTNDGGQTYASDYWHVPNPALKPQHLRTGQATLIQSLGSLFNLTASAFVSRTTDLIQESDADESYAGLYKGWPVAYIDFPVNAGRSTTYGGTAGVDFLKSWSETTHVAARFGMSLADGTLRDKDETDVVLPVGAMSPLQINSGLELTSSRWTASLRSVMYGRQRLLATTIVDGETVRRTLDGYVKVDLNVRRQINGQFDCFAGIENLFDARYRNINARAYNNPEELIGAPQAPRRLIVGVDVRLGR